MNCPHCNGEAVSIAYGLPLPELFEQAERGDVILGGCITGDDPQFECRSCGARFGRRFDSDGCASKPDALDEAASPPAKH